jgi:hypothetical protein
VAAPRLDFPEAVRRLGGIKTGFSEGDEPGWEGSVDAMAGVGSREADYDKFSN